MSRNPRAGQTEKESTMGIFFNNAGANIGAQIGIFNGQIVNGQIEGEDEEPDYDIEVVAIEVED
jgi:hypothetical protein